MNISFAFWCVIGYFVLITIVGYYFVKRVKTREDFTIAGRSLSGIVLAGTLMATWMGSGTVVGGPNSLAYLYGPWFAIIQSVFSSPLGVIVLYFLATKIRRLGKESAADIIEATYGSAARLIASIIMMIAYLGILSYQFTGVAFVLNATLGVSVPAGTIIALIVITFIGFTGGLFSVAYTDFLGAILMLTGLLVGVPIAIHISGGWAHLSSLLPKEHLSFGGPSPIKLIGYILPTLFLVMGDQNMYTRFFAAKDERHARYGAMGWLFGIVVTYPAVAFGASAARALFPNIPAGQALITLSAKIMPTVIGGVAVAAITAFVVTTGTSYVLMTATNLVYDIYYRFINPKASDKHLLRLSRFGVIGVALLGYVLVQFFPTVLAVQMYSYTMYGAAITTVLLAALIWKKATPAAGITTMIVGGTVTVVWEILGKPFGLESGVISIPTAIITLIIVGTISYRNKLARQ